MHTQQSKMWQWIKSPCMYLWMLSVAWVGSFLPGSTTCWRKLYCSVKSSYRHILWTANKIWAGLFFCCDHSCPSMSHCMPHINKGRFQWLYFLCQVRCRQNMPYSGLHTALVWENSLSSTHDCMSQCYLDVCVEARGIQHWKACHINSSS